ncbi:MAG: LPS export ABC transporter periplasmic protein LptC, partial [Candidatus Kapabacteria bacterium]|nr:LPS export ABC transporter periplasmic protein LptC [Candidatus Kapabacteria bacterium]
QDGPQLPIMLEHADSLLGIGPTESGIREFLGNVRFVQGNVTVTCDRAVHNVSANQVDLYGRVVVRQGNITINAPFLTYNGTTHIANAPRGIKVLEGASTVTGLHGTYSTTSHITTFVDSVVVVDDSVRIWSDTLVFDRDADTTLASGRVVVSDNLGTSWITGDRAFRDVNLGLMRMWGNAASWQWDSTDSTDSTRRADTMHVAADTLIVNRALGKNSYVAISRAELVRGGVSARSDSMVYSSVTERFDLHGHPILWSDSLLLVADTIVALVPGRKLHSVLGISHALLISRTDTLFPDRFDQIAGDQILLSISEDTVRRLTSTGKAQSITFRTEASRPEGVAKVASDTIRAIFDGGQLSDVYWLGGIEGEHHPEPVVSGRADVYRLFGFVWRTDRPRVRPLVRPFSMPVVRAGSEK